MKKLGKKILVACLAFGLSVMSLQVSTKATAGNDKITDFTLSASSEVDSNPIAKAKDDDLQTFWESNWRGSNYTPSESSPIIVTLTLAQSTEIGIMKLTPRQGDNIPNGDGNGRWKKARYTLYDENGDVINTFTETHFTDDQTPNGDPIRIEINDVISKVQIEILSAYSSTATLAEVELYTPVESNGIASIEANTQESSHNQGIDKAIDQDESTIWHSAWSGFSVGNANPAVVTITRDNQEAMSKLIYTTRPYLADGDDNGNIKFMKIYTSNDKTNWKYLTEARWNASAGTKDVSLNGNSDLYVKLEILEGQGNFASAAEFKITKLEGKHQIDASLIDTVKALGLAPDHYQGWESTSAKRLLEALNKANTAYAGEDLALIISSLEELKTAYQDLEVDKKPLLDKIIEAQNVDCVGKNPNSVANLKKAIENAYAAMSSLTTPQEVAFEVTQLSEAMLLSDAPIKDTQIVTDTTTFTRDNNFNEGWLFKETQVDSASTTLDESQFVSINLPHDFSISHDFTTAGEAESAFLLGGTGWYRKHIVLPKHMKDKTIQLVFDGAYMDTTLYVNGQKVGENHNGYNRFTFDITEYVTCDGETDNVIAVEVISPLPSSRWYSGSGIDRDVTLRVLNETHIDDLGTFISTPSVTSNLADVEVSNTIVHRQDTTKVQTIVYDPNGKIVAQTSQEALADDTITQHLRVTNPKLWTVKSNQPALYQVESIVYNGEEEVDRIKEAIGFKTINFTREEGFFLNGENIKLKGVCMHSDQGALGAAVNYHAVYRQMKIMKEMGVNAIRVTHNPAPEAMLRACDELGLLVINEAFDHLYYSKNNNYNDFARWFNTPIDNGPYGTSSEMTWAEYVARQMVKTSRNHASILMYSVGNELLEGGGSDQGYVDKIAEICAWFHEEDPYHRPTIGDNKAKGNNALAVALCEEVHKAGGIVGFNYASTRQYEDLRNAHPDWILYGSETSSAHHSRNVYWTNFKDEENLWCTDYENETSRAGWGHSASTAWRIVEENDWNVGEFVWTGFDYLGEPTPWNGIGVGSISGQGPAPRSSYFGIVDTTGFAKDIYYLYQSLWNDDVRTLHMSESWNDNLVKENDQVKVQVFTDADKVVLYLNGNEVGTKIAVKNAQGRNEFDGRYFAEFNLPYEAGTISVKAFDEKNGSFEEVTNTQGRKVVTTSKAAAKTKLEADKQTLECDGYDLSYITVDILDEDNNFVPDNNQKLIFTLEGEGRIVGVDNGNQADTQSFRIDDPMRATRNAFNGKALVIIQSTKRAGDIRLQVKGIGIETNTITLHSSSKSTEETLSALEFVSKYAVIVNETVELPNTVTGIFSNGTSKELKVTWDTTSLDNTKAGIYSVKGAVEGYDATAVATVNVYDTFAAAQDYSLVMHEGSVISLPNTRKVYYNSGEVAAEFAVVWNYYDTSTYQAGNTYTVEGTIAVANQRIPVIAHIRVVDALPQARNLAMLASDMPVLSQSCVQTADNLASLNNGVKTSSASSERWTDYNQQDVKNPWVSYQWNSAYTISDIVAYIYQDANSCVPREMEIELETLRDDGQWIQQEISYITPVSYTDGDGKTTVNLKEPVTTNGIRFHLVKPAVDTFTGLTELEVFEYVPKEKPNDNASMRSITIDGQEVEGFLSDQCTYTLTVETIPDMSKISVVPVGIESTSTYLILKDETNHTISVVIRAEDGSEMTYTFTYQTIVHKEDLEALVEKADQRIQADYTKESWALFEETLKEAKAALQNGTQAEINEAQQTLQQAMDDLTIWYADYQAVEDAKACVPDDLSVYTAQSVQRLKQALAAVKEGHLHKEQAIVDGYAKAIRTAVDQLEIKTSDKGEVIIDGLDQTYRDLMMNSMDDQMKADVNEAIQAGKDVIIQLTHEQLHQDQMTDGQKLESQALYAFAKEHQYTIGALYDIRILLQTQAEIIGQIHQLNQPIQMELMIPQDLLKEGRTYFILRIHEGVVDVLDATRKDHILMFETDKFSTYAIAYQDQTDMKDFKEPNKDDADHKTEIKDHQTPNTGDDTSLQVVFFLCISACLVLVMWGRKQKLDS